MIVNMSSLIHAILNVLTEQVRSIWRFINAFRSVPSQQLLSMCKAVWESAESWNSFGLIDKDS